MSNTKSIGRSFIVKAASILMFSVVAVGAWGQDTTVSTIRQGGTAYNTQVKNAEVVYVEGNDLVLRLENGKIEHMVVPDSDVFTIDGRDISVSELVPGTKITQSITTSTVPHYVNSVRVLKGKIWHVNPPRSVILTLPDGKNQTYTVPDHAKLTIGGKKKTVFDLKKGMTLEATIVNDETHNVTEVSKTTIGQSPVVETPTEVGLLLFFQPTQRSTAPEPVMMASAEEPMEASLPATGSPLPLIALLGGMAIAVSFGVGAARRASVKA